MKGFIEHDGRNCDLGLHSNRTSIREMCPVYLEVRRSRLRAQMKWLRFTRKTGVGR